MTGLEEWMEESYTLKEKHFKIFKDEFLHWIDVLGLKGWEFIFNHIELEDARAQIMPGQCGRVVIVLLNKTWDGQEPSDYELRRTGFHEALELFFSKITHLAHKRSVTEDDIEEENHNLIRILENTIWEADYAARPKPKGKKK